jgi:hypothetical protein
MDAPRVLANCKQVRSGRTAREAEPLSSGPVVHMNLVSPVKPGSTQGSGAGRLFLLLSVIRRECCY